MRTQRRILTSSVPPKLSVGGQPAATRLAAEIRNSNVGFSSPAYRLILALFLIVAFQFCRYSAQASGSNNRNWQLPGHNKSVPNVRGGRNKKLLRTRSTDGVDYLGFDSKAPKDQNKQQSPAGDSSSNSTTDLDESDNALDDLSVDAPRRSDHNVAQFSACDLEAVKVRTPQTTQFSLSPTPSFFYLHAHTPKRGPPASRAEAWAKADTFA